MWKYITRNVRETFERRICSSLTDSSGQEKKSTYKLRGTFLPTINSFCGKQSISDHKCRSAPSSKNQEDRNQGNSWSDAYIRHTWIGAIGWSTALVLSWNLLQPLCRLQFAHEKEKHSSWNKYSSSTRWGGAKGWHFKRESNSPNKSSHWHCICLRSKKVHYQPDSIWDSEHHSFDASHKNVKPNDNSWDSGNHSEGHERHNIQCAYVGPLHAPYDSNRAGFWKLLTQTVCAQPTHIVPNPIKHDIECPPAQKDEVDYGPPTAEQALDDAAIKLIEAQNSLMGDIDNRLGVELMQQGKHHEAFTHFMKANGFKNVSAAYNLGVCYEMGLGTNQDFKKAAKYYQLASDKHHPTAMYNLGVFYIHGWGGLASDCNKAHKLFEKASALGQIEAKKALHMVQMEEIPPLPSEDKENSHNIVQQALGLVQDLGLSYKRETKQSENVMKTSEHKDLSDMVHDSILKYTSMLQK